MPETNSPLTSIPPTNLAVTNPSVTLKPFSSLIGQPQAVELLTSAIEQQRLAPAYVFAGPAGIGKRLGAKSFSEALLGFGLPPAQQQRVKQRLQRGNHPDWLWIAPTYLHQGKRLRASEAEAAGLKRKAPPQIRVEQVREMIRFLSRPPLEASRLVVIIEEGQLMAEGAANALLKTLEEPGRATLVLMAPGLDTLLPTLVSRCQYIPFYRLSEQALRQVLQQNGYGHLTEQSELLGLAQGCPGTAIAAWEFLDTLPTELRDHLKNPPRNALEAMTLAQTIEQTLDTPAQLWLVDYWQYCDWQRWQHPPTMAIWDRARQRLLSYVQPRLVWEATLLTLAQTSPQTSNP